MEKKTCTKCGTEYAAEAAQCPVCGSGLQENADIFQDGFELTDEKTIVEDLGIDLSDLESSDHTDYNWEDIVAEITGNGKRDEDEAELTVAESEMLPEETVLHTAMPQEPETQPAEESEKPAEPKKKDVPQSRERKKKGGNAKVLIAGLVVAVLAVGAFAAKELGLLDGLLNKPAVEEQEEEKTPELPVSVVCSGVTLSETEVALTAAGEEHQLEATVEPAGCTDAVTWESADPAIATVDAGGKVTAVANGETTVLVRVGDYAANCAVTVTIAEEEQGEQTEQTEQQEEGTEEGTTEETEVQDGAMALNLTDITMRYPGEQARLSVENAGDNTVTWSTDNDVILSVDEDGLVTALGTGTTNVYAEVNGEKFTCIVRCALGGTEGEVVAVSLSSTDITMRIAGETYQFTVEYANGAPEGVTHTWSTSDEAVCTIDENGIVTAVGDGLAYITTTADGVTLRAAVHVYLGE